MNDYLLEQIFELTGDKKSKNFWRKAITLLGDGIVGEEVGELKYQMHKGTVENPAKYLTKLLKKRMPSKASEQQPPVSKLNDYFSPNQITLFKELEPKKTKDLKPVDNKKMDVPYSSKHIPWATFVGPNFFSLSTNKAKSDKILARFRTLDGAESIIPMIRGRYFPGGDEYGILTAEHGKILGALDNIWADQGGQHTTYANGAMLCWCDVSVRKLAKLLGLKSFSGDVLKHLKNKIIDLKVRPFHLDLGAVEEFRLAGFKGYGFTFLADVVAIDKKEKETEETILQITFSDPYSRQLLARRAVTRSRELISKGGELTFLVRLYLEPLLIKRGEHTVELKHLIQELNLPPAIWHKYPSKRKQEFGRVVKELNGQKVLDSKIFAAIEEGLTDYLFYARLEPAAPAALPAKP